jgi:hypothetical protein
VEYTDEFGGWWESLSASDQSTIDIAVDELMRLGPALGRPWVDTIHQSRHPNMKELRPRGSSLRILFAFDPRRVAILLIGGDKRDRWSAWYADAVPQADELYDRYLGELRREGLL